jgi:hypothetical protein
MLEAKPIMGDWNDDGRDTIVFADLVFALGNPGDRPIAGNWDWLP